MKKNNLKKNKLKKKRRKHNKRDKHNKHNKHDKSNNPNILFYSSLVFITNIITSFYKEYYTYGLLFILLTITSLIFHSCSTLFTNIIDKVSILCIVLYGTYMLYTKITVEKTVENNILAISVVIPIVISFILCIFLFTYGYYTNQYCFHSKKCIGDKYHALLHLISSIGHHLIIFL
jgi:hypothetical protein